MLAFLFWSMQDLNQIVDRGDIGSEIRSSMITVDGGDTEQTQYCDIAIMARKFLRLIVIVRVWSPDSLEVRLLPES